MAKESRPLFTHKWANSGAIGTPTSGKIDLGWVGEKPPYKWFNYIENRQDQALAYIMQQGVGEWDNTVEYQSGTSYVSYSGNIYVSIQTGTNKQPDTETTYWKLYGKKFVSAPSSTGDTGAAGDWAVDDNYIYVCVATNTWKRSALSVW